MQLKRLYRSLGIRFVSIPRRRQDHLPSPNNKPTGYSFQGRSTAFRTGPISFIKSPPPCTSPCPGAGLLPVSTRFLVLIAVRRKKILITAMRKRNTAETAVPTVPPISPTANNQLSPTRVSLAYHRVYRISQQKLLWQYSLL